MSWDATLRTLDGDVLGEWNYTYNTTPMVWAAADAAGVEFDGFHRTLDGMAGPVAAIALSRIRRELLADAARYEAMNPPNDWGSYDGIVRVITEMIDATPEAPSVWEMS